MEDLITLVKLLSKQKIKQIEIITEDAEMSPKTRALYEGIRDGMISNDEDAMQLLYGDVDNGTAFRKLKYRLKQRLVNTLFFIDIQAYSKSQYQRAHANALKSWSAYNILIDKGLRPVALEFAENALKLCLKNDLLNLSLVILKELKFQYGIFTSNKYKFQKYDSQYKEVKQLYDLRDEIDEIYIVIAQTVLQSRSLDTELDLDYLEKRIVGILNDGIILSSYFTTYFAFTSWYYIKYLQQDVEAQVDITTKAIRYFEPKQDLNSAGIFTFTQKQGVALLTQGNYEKSIQSFNNCLILLPTAGKISWHNLYDYIFIANILQRDYDKACLALSTVINHKGHQEIGERFKEPWYVKEAFMHFLIRIGKVDQEALEQVKLRPFRLNRFLNEVSTFSKDKRGLNITINILQMLFLIVEERYDDVLDKLSALRQYNFRYLKRPEYARSSNFIKMLLKIPEGDYKASTIRKKAQKYYEQLLKHPNDYSEHALSLEIIPYEQLWEELLSIFPE